MKIRNLQLFLLLWICLFVSALPAAQKMQLIYCPSYFYKGELSVVKLSGIKKKAGYLLVVESPVKQTNFPVMSKKQAVFLIGIPEYTKKDMRFKLYENGMLIISNEMALQERTRKEVSFSVAQKFIVPDPALTLRIKKEAKLLLAAKAHYTNAFFFNNFPSFPVTNTKLGSLFGERRTLNTVKKSVHYGLDISSKTGDIVKTVYPGVVVLAQDLYYGGQTVMIQHGFGLISQYSHLSKMIVAAGDFVTNSMVIGLVGSTGMSTGPHLHFSCYYKKIAVDPLSVISYMQELW